MGLEVKARIVPPIERPLLINAFKEKFASLGWRIVCENVGGFSVATHDVRCPGEWDEDFIIGLMPDAAQTAVVTHHIPRLEEVNLTVVAVNEMITDLGSLAWWEEA